MSQTSTQRRLAAILVADVVSYSRLMEADETGTLAALRDRRKGIVEPLVRQNNGRVVKFMGDGVLVEFASAVNALRCALDLQKQMGEANEQLPDAQRIVLRVGVNLGEVVGEGSDIFGEGVNIAARLEGLAEPGGICISGKVHDEIRSKLDFSAADLGDVTLKNVTRPVRAFRIAAGIAPSPVSPRGPAGNKTSIAVLPFANLSGDPRQDYLGDGLSEDIIAELGRFLSLTVIGKSSSFRFRGGSTDAKSVGQKLGVQYLVDGSVRRSGQGIRVSTQLIDTATDAQIWSERYERSLDGFIAMQDDVVHAIVATFEHRLADMKAGELRSRPQANWAAYDFLLRARQLLSHYSSFEKAEEPLRRAIELDPSLVEAHARLVHAEMGKFWAGDGDPAHIGKAFELAEKALSVNSMDSFAHGAMSLAASYSNRFDLAMTHAQEALKLNPNNLLMAKNRGVWLLFLGKNEEALAAFDDVLRRDPYPPMNFWEARGGVLYQLGRYEESLMTFQKIPEPQVWERAYIVACLMKLRREAEAKSELVKLLARYPKASIARVLAIENYQLESSREHLAAPLRTAGMPE